MGRGGVLWRCLHRDSGNPAGAGVGMVVAEDYYACCTGLEMEVWSGPILACWASVGLLLELLGTEI